MKIDLEKLNLPLASEYEIYVDGALYGKINTKIEVNLLNNKATKFEANSTY